MGFKLFALSFSMLAVSFFVLKNSRLDSKSIQLEPSPPFTGKLAPNTKLEKATYLAKGKIRGPETVEVAPNGLIYTGLANGEVVSVDQSGTVRKIALIGNVKDESICKMEDDDPQCGRPAGMRLRGNYLYVADTYYGIVKIDVTNGKKTTVVNPNDKRFGDKPVKFANDLDIDEHGVIYFIDSSYLRQGVEVLEEFIEAQPRGRMFSYDERTNELKQLLDGLYFPNGIQLVASRQIVLINEITMARIVKYHLSGEKKGKVELFAVLPGFGDTLRLTPHQTILSPFAVVRDSKFSSLLDLLGEYPTIRNFIGTVVPPKLAWELAPKYGLLVEYDLDGNILKSWHDPSGKIVESTSSAFLHKNKVYLGSVLRD